MVGSSRPAAGAAGARTLSRCCHVLPLLMAAWPTVPLYPLRLCASRPLGAPHVWLQWVHACALSLPMSVGGAARPQRETGVVLGGVVRSRASCSGCAAHGSTSDDDGARRAQGGPRRRHRSDSRANARVARRTKQRRWSSTACSSFPRIPSVRSRRDSTPPEGGSVPRSRSVHPRVLRSACGCLGPAETSLPRLRPSPPPLQTAAPSQRCRYCSRRGGESFGS